MDDVVAVECAVIHDATVFVHDLGVPRYRIGWRELPAYSGITNGNSAECHLGHAEVTLISWIAQRAGGKGNRASRRGNDAESAWATAVAHLVLQFRIEHCCI